MLNIRLGGRQTELDQGDLGADDLGRRIGAVTDFVVREDQAVDHLSVLQGARHGLADLDVSQVDVVLNGRVDNFQH